jgi:hypothetical protein
VIAAEVGPLFAEDAHDCRAEFNMSFAFRPINVGFAKIADVVNKESQPDTRIEREAVKFLPCQGYKDRMQHKLMSAKEDALRTSFWPYKRTGRSR